MCLRWGLRCSSGCSPTFSPRLRAELTTNLHSSSLGLLKWWSELEKLLVDCCYRQRAECIRCFMCPNWSLVSVWAPRYRPCYLLLMHCFRFLSKFSIAACMARSSHGCSRFGALEWLDRGPGYLGGPRRPPSMVSSSSCLGASRNSRGRDCQWPRYRPSPGEA
jgi:hypothetical protein